MHNWPLRTISLKNRANWWRSSRKLFHYKSHLSTASLKWSMQIRREHVGLHWYMQKHINNIEKVLSRDTLLLYLLWQNLRKYACLHLLADILPTNPSKPWVNWLRTCLQWILVVKSLFMNEIFSKSKHECGSRFHFQCSVQLPKILGSKFQWLLRMVQCFLEYKRQKRI